MIVVEHLIKAIVGTIPAIRFNENVSLSPKFHWGDEMELNRFIQLNKEKSYPLIWLLPSQDRYVGNRYQDLVKECSFVIATRETRKDLFNDERYLKTFDLVLNPLTGYLVHGLTSSSVSERDDEEGYSIFKHPNYSAESEENGTIDIWDAIKLDIKIKFKGGSGNGVGCLKPIYYG